MFLANASIYTQTPTRFSLGLGDESGPVVFGNRRLYIDSTQLAYIYRYMEEIRIHRTKMS